MLRSEETMVSGILAGIFWAIETIVLSFALTKLSFSDPQSVFLASFVSTFIHDSFSTLWSFIYNSVKGNLKRILECLKSADSKFVVIAAILGGPVGMSGYVMTINYMGASIGAVASAIYPAIGAILAYFFLKERLHWYRWIFLIITMVAVYGLSYSSQIEPTNFVLGIIGVLMCSFGWGSDAVILAKSLKSEEIKDEYALLIRQATSCLTYAIVILPLLNGYTLVKEIIEYNISVVVLIGIAALFATISYLFYYKAISKIGPSKAMALNVSYSGWAMIFTIIIQLIKKETVVIEPLTIICTVIVIISSILVAADIKELFKK